MAKQALLGILTPGSCYWASQGFQYPAIYSQAYICGDLIHSVSP